MAKPAARLVSRVRDCCDLPLEAGLTDWVVESALIASDEEIAACPYRRAGGR
jgi:hypothetical protein